MLMLVFLAALDGFGLTGDLFNLFVFFELMSAAAIALCGYKSEETGPLQGAFNFGVTYTVGAFLVLSGIGLLYGRTGALNMAQIGHGLGATHDGLAIAAFCLISFGFLVKAAAVPFHLWLPDAHAVAPTPVCILFSGVMVEAGLYAVVRVYAEVFSPAFAPHQGRVRAILIVLGILTALVGGVMCLVQRHLKRLLAFSTISHLGVMLLGFALLTPDGVAGTAIYVAGHGMVKASLFLWAGILLHRYRSVDERKLHGVAREDAGIGSLFALGGIGLAGVPPFGTFLGAAGIEEAAKKLDLAWLDWVIAGAGVLTAAAVLRASARIFLGLGHREEIEEVGGGGAQDEAPETQRTRALPVPMVASAVALLLLGIAVGLVPGLRGRTVAQAHRLLDAQAYQLRVLTGASPPEVEVPPAEPLTESGVHALLALLAAICVAGGGLYPDRLASESIRRLLAKPLSGLRRLHSGHVGDYVAWLVLGVAGFGAACAFALR